MTRHDDLEDLYDGLTVFVRRSRELSNELHPGLSLVAFNLLSFIEAREETRAADIATTYGLDKSTVSRQIESLTADGLLRREARQPGRRGNRLVLTKTGTEALATAADTVRALLTDRLADWSDRDIAAFVRLVTRFNVDTALD